MKLIPMRDFRVRPGKIKKELLDGQDIVVTSRGQAIGVLAPANGDNFEETLGYLRQARAMAALRRMRERAKEKGIQMSMAEIDRIVHEVRKERAGR